MCRCYVCIHAVHVYTYKYTYIYMYVSQTNRLENHVLICCMYVHLEMCLVLQISMFAGLTGDGTMPDGDMYDLLENCGSSSSLLNQPRKSSDVLVAGRSHEFVEDERKFRIPVFCTYCDGMLQREYI